MSIRAKTKRRVVILLVVSIVVSGVLTGAYLWARRNLRQANLQNRATGMAAYSRKDYAAAVTKLGQFFSKEQPDADQEALFAYAKSRAMVETPDGRHLREAKDAFRKYLDLDPDNVDAQRELLDLYLKNGYDGEAVTLADKLLARFPDDPQALRRKADALHNLHKDEEALPLAEKVNELTPTDLQTQRLTYSILWTLKAPGDKVLERAQKARDKNPDDPRFDLLLGIACIYNRDGENGRKAFRAAAGKNPPDAEFVRALAELFNQFGMFDDCQRFMEKCSAYAGDRDIVRLLVQTLWQNNQFAEVVERLKSLDSKDASSGSYLLAMKALSLYQLNRRDEAGIILQALAGRDNDGIAVAWSMVLSARFSDPPLSPRQLVTQLNQAIARTPRNGIFEFMLGEAFAQLGESEPAMRHWRVAAEQMPGWSRPHVLIARGMLAIGRPSDALEEAHAAHELSPNQVSTNTLLAGALYAQLMQTPNADSATLPTSEQEKRLLEFVTRIQTTVPQEPETLPIYVSLLLRAKQRATAIDAVKASLAWDKLPSETLNRLAALNRTEKLGLDEQIKNRRGNSDEGLPISAYNQAIALAAQGKPTEGLALLQSAGGNAGANPIRWKLAALNYREAIKDAGVANAWVELGDRNPEELLVQKAILKEAASAWTNRPFISRTIDRLKAITGEEAIEWKLARARFLLDNGGDEKQQQADASAASVMLADIIRNSPYLVEPRLLSAKALQAVGNITGAVEQLKSAADLKPDDAAIVFELISLMRAQGRSSETIELLNRIAQNKTLPLDGRKRIAVMFAESGLLQRAVDLLIAHPEDINDTGRNTLLAELYRKQGKLDDARRLYTALLNAPGLTAAAIQAGADFFATHKDPATARKFLDRLDELKVRPGTKELVLALYNDHHGAPEDARPLYEQAAKLLPDDPQRWKALIAFFLRHGQYKEASAASNEAAKNLPNDDSIQALLKQTEAVRSGAVTSDLQPLIESLAGDPQNQAFAETLLVINQTRKNGLKIEQTLPQLRQIADKYPTALPVQTLVARTYASVGRYSDAAAIATRTMQAFPNDPEPAKLAVQILSSAGRWQQAKVAAQQWRLRTLENPQSADLAIAEAQCHIGEANEALATLSGYVPMVKSNPEDNLNLTVTYGKALILSGRAPQAQSLLFPLTNSGSAGPAESGRWRDAWLALAGNHTTSKAAAEWIDKIVSRIPTDAEAQYSLANAWYNLARQFGDTSYYLKTADILDKLTAASNPPPQVWLLLASVNELQGNFPAAEKGYRQVLKLDPKNAIAQNNLAYILLLLGHDLEEGLALAQQAVTSPQATAGFHDTLARLYAKAGKTDLALKSFYDALAMDPNSVEAMIGLADMQNSTGKPQEAAITLSRIESLLKNNSPLSPMLQQQLDALRKPPRTPAATP